MMDQPDRFAAERCFKEILQRVGEDPSREGLDETPARYVRALEELTEGYAQDPAEILSKTFSDTCDEMVVVRDMQFSSLCEHHVLPFHGHATIAYIPEGRVVGLSKLGRLLHCFARRLQVQERMTTQIAEAVMEHLRPKGVAVLVEATHSCMAIRGVRTPAVMSTSCLLGRFKAPEVRAEFLALARGK